MKVYRRDSLRQKRKEEIDLGFDARDSKLLSQEQESDYRPRIQIFTKSKPEHLSKLDEKRFCSDCRSELILLEKTQKLLCKSCGNAIPVMANTPLLETNQELRPFGTQVVNEYDKPFFIGLIDDEPEEPDWEVTSSSGDGRVQHVKLRRGLPPSAYLIRLTDADNSS